MNRQLLASALLRYATVATVLISATVAQAQGNDPSPPPNPYNGNWKVVATMPDGFQYTANVVIDGEGGRWKDLIRTLSWANPCPGLESPIRVLSATPEGLRFRIDMEASLRGCGITVARLKRVDDNTLEGMRADQKIRMTRAH